MLKSELLTYTNSLFGETNLKDTLVVACQHILDSNHLMFEYLFEKGLAPRNTFLIGKIYSTDQASQRKFIESGVYVHNYSFNSHKSFNEQFTSEIQSFLSEIKKKVNFANYKKIIVVDDGAELIKAISNDKSFSVKHICGVEQTTSGYENLKANHMKFPVLNVARSSAKLKLESPYIADAVISKLKASLEEMGLAPKSVLVVGGGSIGENLFDKLKNEYTTKVYDIDSGKSHFSKKKLNSLITSFDVILGCTGTTIISSNKYKLLRQGAVLASSSSSDVEFDAVNLRRMLAESNSCHENIFVNNIHLLNSGFPINFYGTEVEPLNKIQLTRSLMFAAISLANNENYANGLVELDEHIQKDITNKFLQGNP
mgnify:CR=1 FL=1